MPCSNKHGVNCGDDLPVLEQTDDVDASFDNNNYATDVSYVLIYRSRAYYLNYFKACIESDTHIPPDWLLLLLFCTLYNSVVSLHIILPLCFDNPL